jgi:hypothetical protein
LFKPVGEGNTKAGGVFNPPCPTANKINIRAGFSEDLLKFKFIGKVIISTGVTKAAGRNPGSGDKFRNNPNR